MCFLFVLQLLTSHAVRRWNSETQEGVYNMLQLFVDLAATRLKYDPVPIKLLTILTQVRFSFNL